MKRVIVGMAKTVLVCGFGLAGLAAGSAHATDPGPAHGIFCSIGR